MSMQTWRDEYYPTFADSTKPGLEAIQHSLRKWIGLRKENLSRHGVRQADAYIDDGEAGMGLAAASCSLCFHYLYISRVSPCMTCPLYSALNKHSCAGYPDSPWDVFHSTGNPEPMIAALEEALANFTGKL